MTLTEIILLLKGCNESANGKVKSPGNLAVTKTYAFRQYGRTNVDRWIREGLIKVTNRKLDRSKLEAIAALSNRITYLQVAER